MKKSNNQEKLDELIDILIRALSFSQTLRRNSKMLTNEELLVKMNHLREQVSSDIFHRIPIVLIDHESKDLFIAEIETASDIDKILDENKKLNDEYFENENTERDDYYVELENRTGISIRRADYLYI